MNPVNQVAGQARPKAKVFQLRKPNQNSYLPKRKAITRSKKTVRVKYASHKAQMVIDCESALEALVAKHLDLSPAVRDFRPQPTKINLVVNDKPTVYTPDFKVWLKNGQITYVEVKPLSKCFREDVRHKLIAALTLSCSFFYLPINFLLFRRAPYSSFMHNTYNFNILSDSITLSFVISTGTFLYIPIKLISHFSSSN